MKMPYKMRKPISKNNLQEKLTLIHGDATALPFEDNSFDVIINEAMLTMLVGDRKDKALKEYFRVLKPGGRVVTQDVFLPLKMRHSKRNSELV